MSEMSRELACLFVLILGTKEKGNTKEQKQRGAIPVRGGGIDDAQNIQGMATHGAFGAFGTSKPRHREATRTQRKEKLSRMAPKGRLAYAGSGRVSSNHQLEFNTSQFTGDENDCLEAEGRDGNLTR